MRRMLLLSPHYPSQARSYVYSLFLYEVITDPSYYVQATATVYLYDIILFLLYITESWWVYSYNKILRYSGIPTGFFSSQQSSANE